MYFPYLRGKQEELLALQELLNNNALSTEIIPIVEPVKLSSTFINTLQTFIENNRNIYIVQNATVGCFDDDMITNILGDEDDKEKRKIEILIDNQKRYNECKDSELVKPAWIYTTDEVTNIEESCKRGKNILLFNDDDGIENYRNSALKNNSNIKWIFVPEIGNEEGINASLVLFRDRFKKAVRNSDYLDNPDEFFSKDNLIYKRNDYIGFSDYSIVGKQYDETGFSPFAVAIHIVYYNEETSTFRVKHFVSDTNFSSKNPALKFAEAMKKLIDWTEEHHNISTIGLNKLKTYYKEGKYPGLGVVKRHSIMHHLELVGNILDK